jgi:hypothetical protein
MPANRSSIQLTSPFRSSLTAPGMTAPNRAKTRTIYARYPISFLTYRTRGSDLLLVPFLGRKHVRERLIADVI